VARDRCHRICGAHDFRIGRASSRFATSTSRLAIRRASRSLIRAADRCTARLSHERMLIATFFNVSGPLTTTEGRSAGRLFERRRIALLLGGASLVIEAAEGGS
jgi:hypothetical protein